MEGAVDVLLVYQSMLKEHEVSTNAVLEVGITVKTGRKRPVLWEYGSVGICQRVLPELWRRWTLVLLWSGIDGKGEGLVWWLIATPEEEQPLSKRTGALAHYKHTSLSSKQEQPLGVPRCHTAHRIPREHLPNVTGSGKTEMILRASNGCNKENESPLLQLRIDVYVWMKRRRKRPFLR